METASAKLTRKTKQQPTERYVQITETGAKGFEALGCSAAAALVWFEILTGLPGSGKTTISLPNKRLTEMGMSAVGEVSGRQSSGTGGRDCDLPASAQVNADHLAAVELRHLQEQIAGNRMVPSAAPRTH